MFCCGCVYASIVVRRSSATTQRGGAHRYSDDDIRVPLQCLHDLAALQIPEIHLVVFTTGDNPLAAGDTEACSDAVPHICMSHVGLQTSGRLVVP